MNSNFNQRSFKVVKLKFKAPFHISKGKIDFDSSKELIHSDTLKSALYVMGLRLFGKAYGDSASFFDRFTISSAFPYMETTTGQTEYFFPKPMVKLDLQYAEIKEEENTKLQKKIKKVDYLGHSIFEKMLTQENHFVQPQEQIDGGKFLSEILESNPENAYSTKVFAAEQARRVTIPPFCEGKDAVPYYMERIHFHHRAGLYFLVEAKDDFYDTVLRPALRLLAEEGLGTKRNIGNGQFDLIDTQQANGQIERLTLSLKVLTVADAYLNLSLYCPGKEELKEVALEQSSYQLIKRGGWIASPMNVDCISHRKRSVYMFAEGSVFKSTQALAGKIEDLQPPLWKSNSDIKPHPVWRDGRAIFLPI